MENLALVMFRQSVTGSSLPLICENQPNNVGFSLTNYQASVFIVFIAITLSLVAFRSRDRKGLLRFLKVPFGLNEINHKPSGMRDLAAIANGRSLGRGSFESSFGGRSEFAHFLSVPW